MIGEHEFDWLESQAEDSPDSLDHLMLASSVPWLMPPAIGDVEALGPALAAAKTDHEARYRAVQEEMLRSTFDIGDTPASVRAAEAIARIAGLQPRRRKRRTASAAR